MDNLKYYNDSFAYDYNIFAPSTKMKADIVKYPKEKVSVKAKRATKVDTRFVKNLAVGEKVALSGRIQSREYTKKLSEQESKIMTAYEVSISRLAAYENVETFDLLYDFGNKKATDAIRRIII